MMRDIKSIDKNFKVNTKIEKDDLVFYNALDTPFEINGVFYENGKFRRMPEETAKTVNKGVYTLHTNTAGGRIRFKTDSPYVAINAKMEGITSKYPFFSTSGKACFDLYLRNNGKEIYYRSFGLPEEVHDGYESIIEFEAAENREITINFPLYSDVCELFIGVSEDAKIESPSPYSNKNIIVYYGSSITQGACASRPGNSYASIISRKFDCDYINLGFGGSAIAEKEIAEYIKNLNMSVFVYDYDHNAFSPEFLRNTHERMFQIIRDAHPNLPIIMLSRPKMFLVSTDVERLEVIRDTYQNAKNRGDNNVYFIPGPKLMERTGNDGTVENLHPNDFGFHSIAEAIAEVLEKIMNGRSDRG